jgi:hypothetical protein
MDDKNIFFGPEAAKIFLDSLNSIEKESDRGSALVAVMWFDLGLEQAIKRKLRKPSGNKDELFEGPNAPLSSFSAKIEFAYRLGLIDDTNKNMLHLFRKIRNEFAHNPGYTNLNDGKIRNWITDIYQSQPLIYKALIEKFDGVLNNAIKKITINFDVENFNVNDPSLTRIIFNFFSSSMAMVFMRLELTIEPLDTAE